MKSYRGVICNFDYSRTTKQWKTTYIDGNIIKNIKRCFWYCNVHMSMERSLRKKRGKSVL